MWRQVRFQSRSSAKPCAHFRQLLWRCRSRNRRGVAAGLVGRFGAVRGDRVAGPVCGWLRTKAAGARPLLPDGIDPLELHDVRVAQPVVSLGFSRTSSSAQVGILAGATGSNWWSTETRREAPRRNAPLAPAAGDACLKLKMKLTRFGGAFQAFAGASQMRRTRPPYSPEFVVRWSVGPRRPRSRRLGPGV